eukprot:1084583-Prorocentrum_minimum.AAC.1
MSIFSLPFCDWCLLCVYSLSPSAIGAQLVPVSCSLRVLDGGGGRDAAANDLRGERDGHRKARAPVPEVGVLARGAVLQPRGRHDAARD